MNEKNRYLLIGKKIYEKENGDRYGYLFLTYPLDNNGSGYGFTDYSKVYINKDLIASGFMDKFNIGDTVVVAHGWDNTVKPHRKYIRIKSAEIIRKENETADYVPIEE